MKKGYWVGVLVLGGAVWAALSTIAQTHGPLLSALKSPFSLERCHPPEQAHHYRSSTQYDGLTDTTGKLVYRYIVSGEFRRKVVGFREDGCPLEEFQWRNVKITYLSPQDGAITGVKDLDFAEDFTYRLCFEDDYNDISELVDHSNLPNTLEGFLFYEQIIDAHSPFDTLLTRKHGKIHQLVAVGTVVELPAREVPAAVDFRPFGYWEFHPQGGARRTSKFVGLTLVDGQVGAIVETGPSDVPTPFDSSTTMGNQTFTQRMITDTWAQVVVSLEDRLPLGGRMYERVILIEAEARPTRGPSVVAVHRKISLTRVRAAESNNEGQD